MKIRPTATDEEIRSYMNFESVVKEHRRRKESQAKLVRNGLVVGLIIGISALTFWALQPGESTATHPEALPQVEPLPEQQTALPDSAETTRTVEVTAAPTSLPTEKKDAGEIKKENKDEKVVSPTEEVAPVPFKYSEAEPIDGYPHLYEYFSQELRYPQEAIADSIQGVVSVLFVINSDGKPEKITLQNSLGEAFDREARRLIENMPAWKPARLNDKAVAARISMPITFQIVKPKTNQP